MRDTAREFTLFLISGAINTAISYGVYLMLLAIVPYLVAYTISYIVGIAVSYLLLTRFAFKARRRLATAARFPLVYIVQYLASSAVIVLLVEAMDVRASAAAIIAIVLSIPLTFFLSRIVLRSAS